MYSVDELATDNRKLIDSLLQFQKSNKCSSQEMAKRIGCARQTYGRVLNGNRNGEVTASPQFFWKAMQFILTEVNGGSPSVNKRGNNNEERKHAIERKTKETNISLELDIDSNGKYEIKTGIKMFDHLLAQVAQHGRFGITLSAKGDDQHHLVEDVAICMGQALNKALGEKRGIMRMGDATVSMDDALATVVVDINGRGYPKLELPFRKNDMAGFSTDLIRHFLESFAIEAKINLHAKVVDGTNDHHKAEALFKALGRALDTATRIDPKLNGELPSTKEFLES